MKFQMVTCETYIKVVEIKKVTFMTHTHTHTHSLLGYITCKSFAALKGGLFISDVYVIIHSIFKLDI